jgi:hypothetical protein
MLRVIVAPPDSKQVEERIIGYREQKGKVMIISSEHSLDVVALSLVAASRGMNPQDALRGIYLSRAFNMFQAENLMSEMGPRAALESKASVLLAIDIHELFLDETNFADRARRFTQSVWQMKNNSRDLTCELIFRSAHDKGSSGLLGSAISAADEFEELRAPEAMSSTLSSAPLSPSLRALMQ